MKKKEKIERLIRFIEEIEGVILDPSYFADYSEERIDDELDWFDYLMTK